MNQYKKISFEDLIQRRKRIKRELSAGGGLIPIRIAVLGGTTSSEFVTFAEIFLLQLGFNPVFWQCDYGRYFESAVVDSGDLIEFKPDFVYVLTHSVNIKLWPQPGMTEADLSGLVQREIARLKQIWASVQERIGCQIIQNNFDPSLTACLGNLDAVSPSGRNRMVAELNAELRREANANLAVLIMDIHSLSSRQGWSNWFDANRWFSYKILTTPESSVELAKAFSALIGAVRGKVRKCLVLDLDNTLWGGVIGDDGVEGITLGVDSAIGEAYVVFQKYCLELKQRGIILAVCSKNSEENALSGFEHPDSVLKRSDFAAFYANWETKPDNILAIAKTLNIGLDSLVFADDNPAERDLVTAQLPMVAVPDIGNDVTQYIDLIEAYRFFESTGISVEDTQRADLYALNAKREEAESKFVNYAEFLSTLEMRAEIERATVGYLERIVQLINKTNQFNLTTRRYTLSEVQSLRETPGHLCLYGRLADKFGDSGLISVVIAQLDDRAMHIGLWIMSCRVLKRDMELAMLDQLVARAKEMGATSLGGTYIPTSKNGMVEFFYRDLGFVQVNPLQDDARTEWRLDIADYAERNVHIRIGKL